MASISANDTEIGDLIADAMEKVGRWGYYCGGIPEIGTTLEVVEGCSLTADIFPIYGNGHRKDGSQLGRALCIDYR